MEYYSAIKKNEIMSFAATWMDLETVILSEANQTEKGIILHSSWECKLVQPLWRTVGFPDG